MIGNWHWASKIIERNCERNFFVKNPFCLTFAKTYIIRVIPSYWLLVLDTQNNSDKQWNKQIFNPISDQRIFNIKNSKPVKMYVKYLKFVFHFKKKSVNMMTIGEGAAMTDNRIRVTKMCGAVNKKWLERKNRRSKEETEEVKQNGF